MPLLGNLVIEATPLLTEAQEITPPRLSGARWYSWWARLFVR